MQTLEKALRNIVYREEIAARARREVEEIKRLLTEINRELEELLRRCGCEQHS